MNDETERLTIINRLLASFPATQSGLGDDVVDGYLIGMRDVPLDFVAQAAQRFLAGKVPGQHLAFPPSPAQLASEARDAWYHVLDVERRDRELRKLPPPDIQHTPDSHARVGAMVEQLVQKLAASTRTEDAAKDRERSQRQAKVNARFAPDYNDRSYMSRLMGYEVGDIEGEREAG